MKTLFEPNLSHVGVCCINLDRMVEFYRAVFDLQLTDKGPGHTFPFMIAFLSGKADQHHQLALSENRLEGTPSTVMQLSFKVGEIAHLREARRRALLHGATNMRGLNHGNALSIYFLDPEENTVEVYLDTPWYVAQPHGDLLDIDMSDEEIWAKTEGICRNDPSFMMAEDWKKKFARNLEFKA